MFTRYWRRLCDREPLIANASAVLVVVLLGAALIAFSPPVSLDPDDAVAVRDRVVANGQKLTDISNRVENLEEWERSHVQRHEALEANVAKDLATIRADLSSHTATQATSRQETMTIGIALLTLLVTIALTRITLKNRDSLHTFNRSVGGQLEEAKENIRKLAFAAGVLDEKGKEVRDQ